jgi:hypothetical protein
VSSQENYEKFSKRSCINIFPSLGACLSGVFPPHTRHGLADAIRVGAQDQHQPNAEHTDGRRAINGLTVGPSEAFAASLELVAFSRSPSSAFQ